MVLLNAELPIDGGVADSIVTDFKLLQPEKALLPMLVTLLGMVMEVKLLHSRKAFFPMLVTLLGIVMEVRLLQP